MKKLILVAAFVAGSTASADLLSYEQACVILAAQGAAGNAVVREASATQYDADGCPALTGKSFEQMVDGISQYESTGSKK